MKSNYLSQREFEENCPYWQRLTEYAMSLLPPTAEVVFWKGHRSSESTYLAAFNVTFKYESGELEVSCTVNPDGSLNYSTVSEPDFINH